MTSGSGTTGVEVVLVVPSEPVLEPSTEVEVVVVGSHPMTGGNTLGMSSSSPIVGRLTDDGVGHGRSIVVGVAITTVVVEVMPLDALVDGAGALVVVVSGFGRSVVEVASAVEVDVEARSSTTVVEPGTVVVGAAVVGAPGSTDWSAGAVVEVWAGIDVVEPSAMICWRTVVSVVSVGATTVVADEVVDGIGSNALNKSSVATPASRRASIASNVKGAAIATAETVDNTTASAIRGVENPVFSIASSHIRCTARQLSSKCFLIPRRLGRSRHLSYMSTR